MEICRGQGCLAELIEVGKDTGEKGDGQGERQGQKHGAERSWHIRGTKSRIIWYGGNTGYIWKGKVRGRDISLGG